MWWIVSVWLISLLVAFWAGSKYGGRFWAAELAEERKLTATLTRERDDARATLAKIKGAASRAGLDIRKVFPFLTLILALGLGLFGCNGQEAYAQRVAAYRHDGAAVLNDLQATPGATDPRLTRKILCSASFRTVGARNVTESQKKRVCLEYGITAGCPGAGYEIDHLISIELGGANDDVNLWPQPVDADGVIGYHAKDVVENRSHKAVCDGRMTLAQAQDGIRTDWYAFARANGLLKPAGR